MYNDLYNFIYQKEGTPEKRNFDANNFVKELEYLKSQNEEFCYEILVNSETNEFQQAIWMFPEQKINYCQFYDVVIFDNTYKPIGLECLLVFLRVLIIMVKVYALLEQLCVTKVQKVLIGCSSIF